MASSDVDATPSGRGMNATRTPAIAAVLGSSQQRRYKTQYLPTQFVHSPNLPISTPRFSLLSTSGQDEFLP